MKIAIVGPSPVPFTIGGVENVLWKLCETINKKTPHQAELIKLPSKEDVFWNIIENYYNFYKLDLGYFDLVIVTKYPAWMVQHPNCIYYVHHRLRGLYDTYHFTKLPIKVNGGCLFIDNIISYIDSNPNPNNLDEFFNMMFDLKKLSRNIDKSYFSFPGPFIKKVINYMDNYGMSKNRSKKFYAISETVKRRKEYFPSDISVKVIYPPSVLQKFTCENYDYIFMVSRLDGPKRIDMLIKAMKYVTSDVKLLIAGTGPQEKELKKFASKDDRIQFLGFVNDDEVEQYYANSLVVPYFPYDEDYGLITIEAMMHKKPVITTVDAGGPTEFVINNETGFVTLFDAKAIGEKIDYFAKNTNEAKRMGENAYNKVKGITWENTVRALLDDVSNEKIQQPIGHSPRQKITITSTFPIYPPQGGGQARIYNLYKNLAKEYDVNIVSFTNANEQPYNNYIAPGLKEIRIPKSGKHQQEEYNIERKAGIPVGDISMITLSNLTPKYGDALKKSIMDSDIVIISHPYLYNEAKKYITTQKVVYEAHNVEYKIKQEMLPKSKYKELLTKLIFDIEKECCLKSNLIMTCSKEDQATINKFYNVPVLKIIEVPNGVDTSKTYFTSIANRLINKKNLGLQNEKIGMFMGSWHQPNLEACEIIFSIAEKCINAKFMIMGSQCLYFKDRKIPENVGMLGILSETEKNKIFSVADFALNPMLTGSGTNLKMFDYMAAGLPIITTEFGTRGIENKDLFIISEENNMPAEIDKFDIVCHNNMVEYSRKYVEKNFDWNIITQNLIEGLKNE